MEKRFTKVPIKPKKRKSNVLTNCHKKKSKVASSIPAIIDNVVTKEVTVCSHNNCLVKQSMLVVYGINNCLKYVHHIYQNNIDQSIYEGSFERNFGLSYYCLECMKLEMKTEDRKMKYNNKISKISNKFNKNNDIRKINDTLEHVSSKKEVLSEVKVVKDLFDHISSSSDNTKYKESPVIAIDDDLVKVKDKNTSNSSNELNE